MLHKFETKVIWLEREKIGELLRDFIILMASSAFNKYNRKAPLQRKRMEVAKVDTFFPMLLGSALCPIG
jgi:hypothetical protein